MTGIARPDFGVEGIEEADEFLLPVALHERAFERGDRGSGAVALYSRASLCRRGLVQRQSGLGAVDLPDLALLVYREHDGMGRRIDLEPEDVGQLGDKLPVGAQLELTHRMRLQTVRTPDVLYRADAAPNSFGHHADGPMGRLAARVDLRQCDQGGPEESPFGSLRQVLSTRPRPRISASSRGET